MLIFKFIGVLVRLLREMIFDHPDETDFTSAKFNIRKVMMLMLSMGIVTMLFFTTERLYIVAREKQALQLLIEQQKRQCQPIK